MTEREVKRLLFEYGNFNERILEINGEIKRLTEIIENMRQVRAVINDGMPPQGGVNDPTGETAQKIVDVYEKQINGLWLKTVKVYENKKKVDLLLDALSYNEKAVITERYIKKTRWDFIPGKVHISRRWCFSLHKRALRKMCKVKL